VAEFDIEVSRYTQIAAFAALERPFDCRDYNSQSAAVVLVG